MKKNIFFLILYSTFSILNLSAQVSLSITDFGAVNDGTTLNTAAIQAAIDSCHNAGGGEVHVPAGGVFLSGTIFLKSNVFLHLDSAATLKGSGNPAHYPEIESGIRGIADEYRKRSLIYAENQHHIGIVGKGTLDGNSFASAFIVNSSQRVFGVRFISCVNVRYENISMKNSSFWMMHNLNCDTLLISGIKLNNYGVGNNDGIGIDGCRYVRVHNCTVDSYNDALVIKATSMSNVYDVEVYNCTFASAARVIKIGTETVGNIGKIHIHDCVVTESSLQTAEIGIALGTIDGSHIDSVVVENITMVPVQVPLVVRLGDSNRQYIDTLPPLPAGSFKNILLRNISGTGLNHLPCHVTGIPGHYLENIELKNISFTVPGGSGPYSPNFSAPENIADRPEHDLFGDSLPAYGIFMRYVNGITLDSVCITPIQPDARPMIWAYDIQNLTTENVCQDIVFSLKEEQLNNVMKVVYDVENNLIEVGIANSDKHVEPGKLTIYGLDGRFILSKTIDTRNTFIHPSAFPFVWKFETVRGEYFWGRIWFKK